MIPRKELQTILEKYIESENLRHHCEMVATAMEAYAIKLGKDKEEIERWYAAGLLHDLDWEKYPDEHPNKAINEILPNEGISDKELLRAIASHAPGRTGVEPEKEIDRYLFACDELSGFIHAVSLLRPTNYEGMKVKSVKKRLKTPRFAAGVDREDVARGAELINTPIEEHIQFLIEVFQKHY